MTTENDIFVRLSEKIGVVGYPRYVEILKNQLTQEEAELTVALTEAKTLEELKQKLQIDSKTLPAKIDNVMKKRFVVRNEEGKYVIPQMPRFFPRINDTPVLKKLWFDFFHSGDYCEIDVAHMTARHALRPHLRSHKIIPAKQALLASTNLDRSQILWYEDMEGIFRRAKRIAQGGLQPDGTLSQNEGCGCRRYWGTCGAPGGCTAWEWQPDEWGEGTPQGLPFGGRGLCSVEQALDATYKMEDFGLINLSPNTAQINSTCRCCECCCEIIHGFKKLANIWELLSPSRYLAVIDTEKCQGCQTCIERCHFDAIEMRKVPGSKKMKAFIINEHCMGCGLCIYKCPHQAMRFELIRPPEHIPTITTKELFRGRVH